MLETRQKLMDSDFPAIRRAGISTLQVNLGYVCNQSCVHCHVNAGPQRSESMDQDTIASVLRFLDKRRVQVLDLTGGAPEMNPWFRTLVAAARERDIEVIDRCNLTILLEPGYEDLAAFLARHQVAITASMPCYEEANVSLQRGKGVYQRSIEALQLLNRLGYGHEPDKQLNLVYNPVGAVLPPPQESLQADYKKALLEQHQIHFNHLLTITNMPINRFGSVLESHGQFETYLRLLKDSFSAPNLQSVMCRQLLSVDWQGYVYDCDFNQMLDLPMQVPAGDLLARSGRIHISELLDKDVDNNAIVVADHCYACTAGQGSSCGGALEH